MPCVTLPMIHAVVIMENEGTPTHEMIKNYNHLAQNEVNINYIFVKT